MKSEESLTAQTYHHDSGIILALLLSHFAPGEWIRGNPCETDLRRLDLESPKGDFAMVGVVSTAGIRKAE